MANDVFHVVGGMAPSSFVTTSAPAVILTEAELAIKDLMLWRLFSAACVTAVWIPPRGVKPTNGCTPKNSSITAR